MSVTVVDDSRAWRVFCRLNERRFASFGAAGPARRRLERLEARFVEQLCRDDLPTMTRAVALRSIVALRDCSVRDVSEYFSLAPQIIVAAMSLVELPESSPAKPKRSSLRAVSHVQAA